MPANKTYECMCCHTVHTLSMYHLTHLADRPNHICDNCGAVHILTEGEAVMITQGVLLSAWFPNTMLPVNDGYYRIMMPAGNVPDKLWWWDSLHALFRFEQGSTVTIHLSSIKAWRGMHNPHYDPVTGMIRSIGDVYLDGIAAKTEQFSAEGMAAATLDAALMPLPDQWSKVL